MPNYDLKDKHGRPLTLDTLFKKTTKSDKLVKQTTHLFDLVKKFRVKVKAYKDGTSSKVKASAAFEDIKQTAFKLSTELAFLPTSVTNLFTGSTGFLTRINNMCTGVITGIERNDKAVNMSYINRYLKRIYDEIISMRTIAEALVKQAERFSKAEQEAIEHEGQDWGATKNLLDKKATKNVTNKLSKGDFRDKLATIREEMDKNDSRKREKEDLRELDVSKEAMLLDRLEKMPKPVINTPKDWKIIYVPVVITQSIISRPAMMKIKSMFNYSKMAGQYHIIINAPVLVVSQRYAKQIRATDWHNLLGDLIPVINTNPSVNKLHFEIANCSPILREYHGNMLALVMPSNINIIVKEWEIWGIQTNIMHNDIKY